MQVLRNFHTRNLWRQAMQDLLALTLDIFHWKSMVIYSSISDIEFFVTRCYFSIRLHVRLITFHVNYSLTILFIIIYGQLLAQ